MSRASGLALRHVDKGRRSKTGEGKLCRLNATLNAILIRELLDGPCTVKDLAAATGMHGSTVAGYLLAMKRKRCVRIAGWERDSSGKQSIRAFALGDGPDARKAPPVSRGEACRLTARRKLLRLVERTVA